MGHDLDHGGRSIGDSSAALIQAGGGELGRLIADYDWALTKLGPLSGWADSLKTTVAIILRAPVPIVTLWGEDGVMIYNDAYSVFAGGRHPALLGSNVREGWPEVAEFNDNVMQTVLAGGTLSYEDQELTLLRHGRPEQVWMNLELGGPRRRRPADRRDCDCRRNNRKGNRRTLA